jgi:hypothetical protein
VVDNGLRVSLCHETLQGYVDQSGSGSCNRKDEKKRLHGHLLLPMPCSRDAGDQHEPF